MADLSLAEAQANLDAASAALARSRTSQASAISSPSGGRSKQVALHQSLLEEVKFWRAEVSRLTRKANGGLTVRGAVPL